MFLGRMRDRRGPEMRRYGHSVARGLCHGTGRFSGCGSGWRGALQAAADLSDQDSEILRVADEIYAFAHLMRTPEAIRTYAEEAITVIRGDLADRFLLGMTDQIDAPGRRRSDV